MEKAVREGSYRRKSTLTLSLSFDSMSFSPNLAKLDTAAARTVAARGVCERGGRERVAVPGVGHGGGGGAAGRAGGVVEWGTGSRRKALETKGLLP